MMNTPPPIHPQHFALARRLGMEKLAHVILHRVRELETTQLGSTSDLSVAEFRRRVWSSPP